MKDMFDKRPIWETMEPAWNKKRPIPSLAFVRQIRIDLGYIPPDPEPPKKKKGKKSDE